MTNPSFRAWQFLHPDLPPSGEPAGLSISPRGRIQMVQEDASVRQAILLLLSTAPGERAGRPDYGCPLHWLIYSPNDDTTAGLAIHYVRKALERWEPRIEILRLDAGSNPEMPEVLDIYLQYRVRESRALGELVSSLNLLAEDS
jgi:uncharacterized protein